MDYVENILQRDAFPCASPKEVRLYYSPWVTGMRTLTARGHKSITVTSSSIEEGFYLLEQEFREMTFYMNCNAILGYEEELYIWENPIRCIAKGTPIVVGPG